MKKNLSVRDEMTESDLSKALSKKIKELNECKRENKTLKLRCKNLSLNANEVLPRTVEELKKLQEENKETIRQFQEFHGEFIELDKAREELLTANIELNENLDSLKETLRIVREERLRLDRSYDAELTGRRNTEALLEKEREQAKYMEKLLREEIAKWKERAGVLVDALNVLSDDDFKSEVIFS